ncbi:RCC1 domain-containing protein [Enhygromyxa salina]|nr:hypothetical protein [Enhygromyxa salina]
MLRDCRDLRRSTMVFVAALALVGCSDDEVPYPTELELELVGFDYSTCSIRSDGELRCWGNGYKGVLGYGELEPIGDDEDPCDMGPVDIGAPVRALYSISHGERCAILDSGQAQCWGWSFSAGYQEGTDLLPRQGTTLTAERDILQLAGGNDHACALLAGGVVRCWGQGALLGYGDGVDRGEREVLSEVLTTLPDVELGGPAIALVASDDYSTCALLAAGGVRCWGISRSLGYGTGEVIGDDETPAQAGDVPLGGRATSLVAGRGSQCALLEDKTLRCWGQHAAYGGLGYGDIFTAIEGLGDDETPMDMGPVPVGEPVERVVMGGHKTCVLLAGGRLRCWGNGSPGELGYGPTVSRLYTPPDEDIEVGGPVHSVALSRTHTCAVLDEGIRCWGINNYGQLGLGTSNPSPLFIAFPVDVPFRPSCEE